MQNINNRFGLKKVLYLILIFGFLTAISKPFNNSRKNTPDETKTLVAAKSEINSPRVMSGATEENKKREKESAQAFIKAYRVFMHPRCMNCHPVGDAPLPMFIFLTVCRRTLKLPSPGLAGSGEITKGLRRLVKDINLKFSGNPFPAAYHRRSKFQLSLPGRAALR
jgi:hypothetical protein